MSMTINQDTQQDYFEKAYNYILRGNDVPGTARLLYLTLSSYAKEDTCYVSIKRLAKDLSCCLETVRKYLRWLKAHGFITITHRRKKNSLEYDTNMYTLCRDRQLWVDYSQNSDNMDISSEETIATSTAFADNSAQESEKPFKSSAESAYTEYTETEIARRFPLKNLKTWGFCDEYISLLADVLRENLNLVEGKEINKVFYQPIEIKNRLLGLTDSQITGSILALDAAIKKRLICDPRNYLLSILMRAHADEAAKHLASNSYSHI